MAKTIGQKIKDLRTRNKMTLKEVSQRTNLSIGFLSQLERGLTDIATDSLGDIASALGVDLSYFFAGPRQHQRYILRSYEKEVFRVDLARFIHYHLTNQSDSKVLLPRLIELLPINCDEDISVYNHEGEEFIYVLEGILTLFLDHEQHELYPGDTVHYKSTIPHNWANYTSKMTRILVVSIPNPFHESSQEEQPHE